MHFRPPEEQNDHKVTCGVNTAVLQRVLDSIQQRLDSDRVQANIITSGTGMVVKQTGRGRGGGLAACMQPVLRPVLMPQFWLNLPWPLQSTPRIKTLQP